MNIYGECTTNEKFNMVTIAIRSYYDDYDFHYELVKSSLANYDFSDSTTKVFYMQVIEFKKLFMNIGDYHAVDNIHHTTHSCILDLRGNLSLLLCIIICT